MSELLQLLTPMERRVTELVATGRTNPQIADVLVCSESNVKSHIKNVFTKLRVHTRSELAALVAGQGHQPVKIIVREVVREVHTDQPDPNVYHDLRFLQERVEDLQRAHPGAATRWQPTKPPSRQTLAVAVRRVGAAQGRHQTAERLRHLAAEALAWADTLAHQERPKERAA